MPFRHVVMFQWADDAPDDQVEQRPCRPRRAARVIPQIRSYRARLRCRRAEGNFDYVLVADFDNVNDWRVYRDHPVHVLFIEEHIKGKVENRAAVQYQTPVDRDPHDYSHARMQELLAQVDELG